jgi:IS30 family transposase
MGKVYSRLGFAERVLIGEHGTGGAPMKCFTDYVSIEQRSDAVGVRETPGHFEADLMAFRQNSQFILVAHERLSRKAFDHRQPDKTAQSVRFRLTKTVKSCQKLWVRPSHTTFLS